MPPFEQFPKIGRLKREILITEKIDGTNAQVFIDEDPELPILAGSRTRWITPEQDNFGFAAWVAENEEDLRRLGPGRHYGEWWGKGIQRGYGIDTRVFSLFNVARWHDNMERPFCTRVVPLLYRGEFRTDPINDIAADLKTYGSKASPGYMRPEGLVVFHPQSHQSFKLTLDGDGHKGA